MMMSYRDALNQAMREEMRRDDKVFLIGEEVGYYQGAFKVSKGFVEEFGPTRVFDTRSQRPVLLVWRSAPRWPACIPSLS
jgi:pyruvate/2-oxoglutarate/acetoin dehydrogenase E1 component